MSEFKLHLTALINCYNMENQAGTPDFILAEYLTDCLAVFDKAVAARERWYGRKLWLEDHSVIPPAEQEHPND